MKIIINNHSDFGTKDGVFIKNSDLRTLVSKSLKNGTAKKVIDTEETLMYIINQK